MEDLNRVLGGLRIEDTMSIQIEERMLVEILDHMRAERVSSLSFAEVISRLSKLAQSGEEHKADHRETSKTSSTPQQEAPKTPVRSGDDSDGYSPSFTFKSPKPFTPFTNKKKPVMQSSKSDLGPFSTETDEPFQRPNLEKAETINNTNFTGFFDTARNSIPGDFDSPSAHLHQHSPPQTEYTETKNGDFTHLNNAFEGINLGPEGNSANNGSAWFWGTGKDSTKASNTTQTNGFNLPQASFNLGAGSTAKARKGKNTTNTLPNIHKPNGHTGTQSKLSPNNKGSDDYIPSFQYNYADTAEKDPTSLFREYGLHEGDEQPLPTATPHIEKKLFTGGAGDLEDDEMSIGGSPIPESPAPPVNNTEFTFGETKASAAFFDEESLAAQFAQSTKLPSSEYVAFNIGAGATAPSRSTKKTGTASKRREQTQKKPSTGTSRPASANPTNVRDFFSAHAGEDFPDLSFPQNLSETLGGVFKQPVDGDDSDSDYDNLASSAFTVDPNAASSGTQPMHTEVPLTSRSTAETNTFGFGPTPVPGGDAPPSWWGSSANAAEKEKTATASFQSPRKPSRPSTATSSSKDTTQPAATPNKENHNVNRNESAGKDGRKGEDDNAPSILSLAELYSKQGKELYAIGLYDRALDAYSKCLNLAPKQWIARATILGNRAAVFFMMKRYMETVDDCDDALSLDPSLVKLLIRKGKSLLKLGHLTPAEDSFKRVLTYTVDAFYQGPPDPEAKQHLGSIIDSAKQEAKAGIRDVDKLRHYVTDLIHAEAKLDYEEVLRTAEQILDKAGLHRVAQLSKARALNELSRYEDSKSFMEELTASMSTKVQALYAHPKAVFPPPTVSSLQWKEKSPNVDVDVEAVKNAILCMGPELGSQYFISLKNVKANRGSSAEVMTRILSILQLLNDVINIEERAEMWSWIGTEFTKLKELVNLKNTADNHFKGKNFKSALYTYSQALKVDGSARRWGAILFSNRAACQMSLGLFTEAVADCHSALAKDADYNRAYLRRARAFRAMNKVHECTRDYRRYLCSDPIPSDFQEVQKELDELTASQQQQHQQQQQQSANSTGSASYTASSARPTSGRQSSGSSRYNQQTFNPFNQPSESASGGDSAGASSSRPGSAKPAGGGFYSHNQNAYAGHSKPTRNQQQQYFNQQQQSQPQQQPRPSSAHQKPNNRTWSSANSAKFEFASSSEDEEEELKPRHHQQQQRATSNKSSTSSNTNGSSTAVLFSLKETDHYVVLGVESNASESDIKSAYRKLALRFHPDKNQDPGAEDRFKMISTAYMTLNDKASRREFDLSRPLSRAGRRY